MPFELPPPLYEDAALIAFSKPAGLAAQGGSGLTEDLERLAGERHARPGKPLRLVHRLDRSTSGVIVLARTKAAAAFLSEAFASRRVRKRYLAIVCGGAPNPPHGDIAEPLKRVQQGRVEHVRIAAPGEPGAQAAMSRYRTRASTAMAALLELSPETGRMHQLRVHLASLGRPIAGDGKYGGLFAVAGVPIPRLMLHAAALALPHPGGRALRLCAPPPADFQSVAEALALVDPDLQAEPAGATFSP